MGSSYLKRYYFDDHKLAQRARLEFYRALSTGRMIAFTGAMTTEAFGYGGWAQVSAALAKAAQGIAIAGGKPGLGKDIIERIEKLDHAGTNLGDVVRMNLIEDLLADQVQFAPRGGAAWPLDQVETMRDALRVAMAGHFRTPGYPRLHQCAGQRLDDKEFTKWFNVPRALWHRLGIRRFATINYDFELEVVSMLADRTSMGGFAELRRMREDPAWNLPWDLGSGRIRRVFDDGWAVESDLLNRERIDRLFEFAVGTDDVDGHVMHLHGRACDWRSMILTQGDYDALYRRNDLNRAPFEFARRMMMGGNPILFLGLGMKEQELNQEMQEFISNTRFHRSAPTFLLWTGIGKEPAERAGLRLQWLRTLGVLTIFDTDFDPDLSDDSPKRRSFWHPLPQKIEQEHLMALLTKGIELLADGTVSNDANLDDPLINPTLREMHVGQYWRSMRGRIEGARRSGQPAVLWSPKFRVGMPGASCGTQTQALIDRLQLGQTLCVIGPQGLGKGTIAHELVREINAGTLPPPVNRMLINGGFSFDTDTLLETIAWFLHLAFADDPASDRPPLSRQRTFEQWRLDETADPLDQRVLLVINGCERFFDLEGKPLSAELDQFLMLVAKIEAKRQLVCNQGSHPGRLSVVLFGTERVRSHMKVLNIPTIELEALAPSPVSGVAGALPSGYFHYLDQACGTWPPSAARIVIEQARRYQGLRSDRISGDLGDLRRAFFDVLLQPERLRALLGSPPPQAQHSFALAAVWVLRVLAFVGVPVCADVLIRIGQRLGDYSQTELRAAIGALVGRGLVLEMIPYQPAGADVGAATERLALHRLLLTELRQRYGIPLNEAKLSTAFNMSLYVAQPVDGDIPDTDIHEDLGRIVDALIGSYRERAHESEAKLVRSLGQSAAKLKMDVQAYRGHLAHVAAACGDSRSRISPGSARMHKDIENLCRHDYAEALRAAFALIRSYYTASGLLTLDIGDRIVREGHDGLLLEHAERLDDLIDAHGKVSLARAALDSGLAPAADATAFAQLFRPVYPFYPEDLIWLHNERGVVRLAMGDLIEARRSFEQALLINRACVERNDRAHNWRRIMLNLIVVDIEQARFDRAERRCQEILAIMPARAAGDRFVPHEDRLAEALATGYLAWCHLLRGDSSRALEQLQGVRTNLADLREVRAQAFFERLRADAAGAAGTDLAQRRTIIEGALSLAQSARQMDIVHRLKLSLADDALFREGETAIAKRAAALRHLDDALSYALQTGVHRVRCEASTMISRARSQTADHEGALRYAADALMIANRYGMELRKLSLRARIARIMVARGHPITAENLARTCIKMATRRSYHTAIRMASGVLDNIPRLSDAISRPDQSGRRSY